MLLFSATCLFLLFLKTCDKVVLMQGSAVDDGGKGIILTPQIAPASSFWKRAAPISVEMRSSVMLSESENSTHCDCLHIRHCYACFVDEDNERKESTPNAHESVVHPQVFLNSLL